MVRGLSRAKKGRDRTTLTPEVEPQLCVATERGDGGRRGLVSSWQPAWPRTGVLCQVLLLSQQSPPPPPSSCQSALGQTSPRHRGPKGQRRLLPAGPPLRRRALPLQTNSPAGHGRTEPVITGPAWPGTLPSAAGPGPGFTDRQLPTEGRPSQLGCYGTGPPLAGNRDGST